MPFAHASRRSRATSVLQAEASQLQTFTTKCRQTPAKCLQPPAAPLIVPIILLRYLQALDDSFSFNKGMQGDKLSYIQSFSAKKKKKKRCEH